MRRLLLLLASVAFLAAPDAGAHAIPVASEPPDGAVLERAPARVLVRFDSHVHVGTRNAAVRNADEASVLGDPAWVLGARTLVVPLESGLGDGVYTVRWSIVSDDGHREEGLIAFAVGDVQGVVHAALTTRGSFTWTRAAMKTLFLLGVLVVVGAVFFTVVVLRPLGLERELARPQADVLFAGFLAAFSGSEALLQTLDAGGTRFAHAVGLAAGASAIGAVAALLTPAYARVRFVAWLAAAVLVLCPTLAGHALDPGSLRPFSILPDIVHFGAAAVWLGGLASLAYTLGRADPEVSARAARRFAAFALVAALLVLASGPLRALTAFSSVGQLWSTDYGRALLVKVVIVVPLLVLAWLNRSRLLGAFARLRRVAIVELLLLSAVVAAVGVLTELPPGRADIELAGVALAPASLAEAPVAPPRRAFVDARRAGNLTVGFALRGRTATVTLVGADGKAPDRVEVAIDGPPAQSCGPGCFRARVTGRSVVVRVDRRSLRFEAPARLSPAGDLLRRATSVFARLASVTIDERAADATGTRRSRIVLMAPDSSSTVIVAGSDPGSIGSRTVVVGGRRWERAAGERWRRSEQPGARVPRSPWSSASRNTYYDGDRTITFFDPSATAWYRLELDVGSARPRRLVVITPGRIVSNRYSRFNRPVRIVRPAA